MFNLYKKNKLILSAPYYEDLISFVEVLKKFNKKIINRREYRVMSNNEIIYSWKKR